MTVWVLSDATLKEKVLRWKAFFFLKENQPGINPIKCQFINYIFITKTWQFSRCFRVLQNELAYQSRFSIFLYSFYGIMGLCLEADSWCFLQDVEEYFLNQFFCLTKMLQWRQFKAGISNRHLTWSANALHDSQNKQTF